MDDVHDAAVGGLGAGHRALGLFGADGCAARCGHLRLHRRPGRSQRDAAERKRLLEETEFYAGNAGGTRCVSALRRRSASMRRSAS